MKSSAENPRMVTRRQLLGVAGALAGSLFLPPTVDARTKRPGETEDRFSREETGVFGYRKMGHNFISGSGGIIWHPDHDSILEMVQNSNDWFLWTYLHPFKDLEFYLAASQRGVDQYQYGISVQSNQVSIDLVSRPIDRQQFKSAAQLQVAWTNGSLALAIARDAQSNPLPFLSAERRPAYLDGAT